jgi:hypothetical protein
MARRQSRWEIRNDHAGPRNARVYRLLTGFWRPEKKDDVAIAIIELFASDEPLDPHAQKAIRESYERGLAGDRGSIRSLIRLPVGTASTWQGQTEAAYADQQIKDEYDRLRAAGTPRKTALQKIIDAGLAESDSSIERAIRRARRRLYRVSRHPIDD